MKKLIILLSVICTIPAIAQPEFELHKIDTWGNRLGQTAIIDMDNDGWLDIVVGQAWNNGGDVVYYKNTEAEMWTRTDIGQGDSDVGGDAYDINGDGFPEFVSGKYLFTRESNGTYSRHDIGVIRNHDFLFADIDGDGKQDAVANSDQYGLVWYSIPDDFTEPWTEFMIDPISSFKIHGGIAPGGVCDIDGDGDLDIATAKGWYEQVTPTQWNLWLTFIELGENHTYGIAVRSIGADLDNDGDIDIIQSECDNPDGAVGWYENNGCGHFTFHFLKVKGWGVDWHGLAVADFDGDGELEIVAGGGPLGTLSVIIMFDKQNGQYVEYVIAENVQGHELVYGDLDNDGDLDIYIKPWADGTDMNGEGYHYWLENKTEGATDPEWQSMFNGYDLTGWEQTGGNQKYYVEDGAIVGEAVQGVTDNAFLYYQAAYGDFHMKGQVNLYSEEMNSGIQFRSDIAPEPTTLYITNSWMGYPVNLPQGRMYGYQMEIAKEATGFIWDEARRGEIDELWGTGNGNFVIGQWNDFEIICEGSTITTIINGNIRKHVNDGLSLSGLIGLQVHGRMTAGDKVMWRDLLIKGTPIGECDTIPPVDPPEPETGHRWQFNGNGFDSEGTAHLDTFMQAGYVANNPPEGSHYGRGEWGGYWVSREEITVPLNPIIEFWVRPAPRSGSSEAVKTIYEVGDMKMLIVMGSIPDSPSTGKVAMVITDETQEDPERGLESYGNVITANEWNHVRVEYKTGGDIMQDCAIIVNGRQVSTMNYSKIAYSWNRTDTIIIGRGKSLVYPSWSPLDDLTIK